MRKQFSNRYPNRLCCNSSLLRFLNFKEKSNVKYAIFLMMFLPKIISAQDTLSCDNGGFESDFLYYKGYVSTFTSGSTTCTPNATWGSPVSLPVTNRLEIVTSGTDPLIGINRTKFGSKAVRINNKYGHVSNCAGSNGIDKLTKRFKVTEETREVRVWYAIVLENPNDHVNQQPFFNMRCDLAINDNYCFDAEILKCEDFYSDPNCTFDSIDVLNWSCHRFKIPKSEIGNIATLEIIAADCGAGAHFGYAYVDGICEDCDGSALGSGTLYDQPEIEDGVGINFVSCHGDKATICGSYTNPTFCGTQFLDSVAAPGYVIYNVTIDTVNKIFCFDFDKSNIVDSCAEVFVELYFDAGGSHLPPVLSNTIEICANEFEAKYDVSATVGECNDNTTGDNLSDDYYYVYVNVDNTGGASWSMTRRLDNPYPGESPLSSITSGSGDQILVLGPYLIQEGSWVLTITVGECSYNFDIAPPEYCSGCDAFNELQIPEVKCFGSTWGFALDVTGGTGSYGVAWPGGSTTGNYGTTLNISGLAMSPYCIQFTLTKGNCEKKITICPPLPCTSLNPCDLEVDITEILCDERTRTHGFTFTATSSNYSTLCYALYTAPGGGTALTGGTITGSSTTIPSGSYSQDLVLVVYPCNSISTCFKVIYIPAVKDCDERQDSDGRRRIELNADKVSIIPNPFNSAFIIYSNMPHTEFELYNSSGVIIKKGNFTGEQYTLNMELNSGIYFVKYLNTDGKYTFIKAIKI